MMLVIIFEQILYFTCCDEGDGSICIEDCLKTAKLQLAPTILLCLCQIFLYAFLWFISWVHEVL